jgi:hypothetical protein
MSPGQFSEKIEVMINEGAGIEGLRQAIAAVVYLHQEVL